MKGLLKCVYGNHFKSFIALGVLLVAPFWTVAQVSTEMRVHSDSFISPSFEAAPKANYQFISGQVKTDAFVDEILKMDIAGGVAFGAPLLNYINISELYVQSRQSDKAIYYLGRKRILWNELDKNWDMGVWEPLFKWNPLSPEGQGLTGLFWQVDKPYYTLLLFASPIYLPDQGPSFEIENGSFVKGNPWFRRPPETIRIWQESTAIDYHFEKPNESQVVLQNSFGAKLSFGDPQSLRAQLSYIYKPVNQLAIGYDGNLDVASLKGAVDLQPQVFYHSLVGADVSHKIASFRFGVSGIYDHPTQDKNFEEKWTHPVFADAFLVSPFLEWNSARWGVSLQRLDIFGGKVTEEGELANSQRAPLMTRYPYQQADRITLTANYPFRKNRRLIAKVSFTHSEKNNFDIVRLSSRLHLSGLWSIFGEMQLVRAGAVSIENQNEITQFVNNDRLMVGAGYAF